MRRAQIIPIIQALLAAFLFGVSAPLSKLLLDELQPLTLAGLLYLGSGLSALLLLNLRKLVNRTGVGGETIEARLKKADLPWLTGAVLAGGVLGPIFLLYGLEHTPAGTTSLLLNFESVATAVIAVLVFKEAIQRRIWWAMGLITLASLVLSLDLGGKWGFSFGALAILGACLMWGVDNNLTRNISSRDPLQIVMIKGFTAGAFSFGLSLFLGFPLPDASTLLLSLLLGGLSYGVGIALFVLALRGLGAARTGALYATAPFIGVLLSFVLLHEALSTQFLFSLPFMLLGAFLLFSETHDHEHHHTVLEHEHCHRHDDQHHGHAHDPDNLTLNLALAIEEHSHRHSHEKMSHNHHHAPDAHHWHEH